MQPMKAIMDKAIAAEADGTVLNTSLFGCFPLADIPHVGLSAVVVADGDRDRAERFLCDLLAMAWTDREGFVFNVDPIADSVAEARRRAERDGSGPVIPFDHGENCALGAHPAGLAVL